MISPHPVPSLLALYLLLAGAQPPLHWLLPGLSAAQNPANSAPQPGVLVRPATVRDETGCGVQYEPGRELTRIHDVRIETVFANLLRRAGITESVLLCVDIPLEKRNFAESVRRSDGQALVAVSHLLVAFANDEIAGVLAHEVGHLRRGDVGRARPVSTQEYVCEERAADIEGASLVGPDAMRAALKRAYETSIKLGFESNDDILRSFTNQRLRWIRESVRGVPSGTGERTRTAIPSSAFECDCSK